MSAFKAARDWMAESTLAHVAFGFLSMGAWAWFANRNHPLDQALIAALVQGTISGALTLVLKKALERMSAFFALANNQRQPEPVEGEKPGAALRQAQRDAVKAPPDQRQPEPVEGQARNLAALAVPPLITATSILTILVTAHTLAGTPEVASTIAVPFTVSTSYAILYNLRLWRAANGRR